VSSISLNPYAAYSVQPCAYYELLQHFQQVDAIWRGQKYNEHYDDPLVNKLGQLLPQGVDE
jgi:hypothetical protein